jgi:pilus assembly protein CpaC
LVAEAQQASLRAVRPTDDRVLTVMVDQAMIVESDRPFAEVQIAQPEIADVQPLSERSIYVLGRGRGRTSLALLDFDGRVISNVTVVVQPDITELKQRLSELLPGQRVEVRPAGGGVVLSGAVSGAAVVERAMSLARAYAGDDVTNMMTVGGNQQVSLKVRIAEMNRSAAKELGIGLGGANSGDPRVGIGTGGVQPIFPPGGGDAIFLGGPAGGFGTLDAVFSLSSTFLLNVSIDALERKGFARVLAEPNLVALSGGEAQFLAGGEVPIPLINGDGEVDVQFRPVGVGLNFRPTVLDDGAINVSVSAEVAAVDPALGTSTAAVDIPGFTVRRATTAVELRDGQSFAIAGLYQDDFKDAIQQVPWIGEVPVLGTLFRSVDFQRGETELIVIVSATLVSPVEDADALATPLDRVRIPTETEFFLLGQTSGAVGPDGAPVFQGPFGYVLD